MMTIIANSVGEMTPSSRPMLSTISSIRPRVFIRMPRRPSPPIEAREAGGDERAAEFAERGDENDQPRRTANACQPETRPICVRMPV